MDSLFEDHDAQPAKPRSIRSDAPLAERVRPTTLDAIAGQTHLLAEGSPLRAFVERGQLPSMILWGPPGTGKTTLAYALSDALGWTMERLSAVEAGVKDLREVLVRADRIRKSGRRFVLFIDEIHRFNKGQQDALLHAVERGTVTLIGATTENPSFEVNSALLSRCQVYRLHALSDDEIRAIVERALADDKSLYDMRVVVADWDALLAVSGGDARSALNAVESATNLAEPNVDGERVLTREVLRQAVQQRVVMYDRAGDMHYDTISAFIKSLRGSDPDAALLYLAIMIEAGEDPLFIARRMVVFASEDIGNADPLAITLALSVFQSVERIGMPEGRIPLAQGVTYLASAPKSNASYMAITYAQEVVKSGVQMSIPLQLRNAPTRLMKDQGYGAAYKYPHDFDGHFVREDYFPDGITPVALYKPSTEGREDEIQQRLRGWWPERYGPDA